MADLLFSTGLVAGAALMGLLLANVARPELALWPTSAGHNWRAYSFWALFRAVNISTVASALLATGNGLGVPVWIRVVCALLASANLGLYLLALYGLGRNKTYCDAGGLVTDGIYRWTRNPQYATIMPFYAGLAGAVDSLAAYALSALTIAIYLLMALGEEPWLDRHYGEAYRAYKRAVPRFVNFGRIATVMWVLARRLDAYARRSTSPLTRRAVTVPVRHGRRQGRRHTPEI